MRYAIIVPVLIVAIYVMATSSQQDQPVHPAKATAPKVMVVNYTYHDILTNEGRQGY